MDRSFEPLTPHTGTEVLGVDLAKLTPMGIHAIQRLLKERLVLVFRDQRLDREQHKALARHFGIGVLRRYRPEERAGDDPEVQQVTIKGRSRPAAGAVWRSDLTACSNPISTSLLYLTEPPGDGGGDTVFANMYLAYETLSDPMKRLIAKLAAIHDEPPLAWQPRGTGRGGGAGAGTQHPVVVKHPETGNRVLWVNRGFTTRLVGVSALEGRHLLEALLVHAETNPALHCRVRWRANTLVMWDNVAAQYFSCWDVFPSTLHGEWVSSLGQALEAAP